MPKKGANLGLYSESAIVARYVCDCGKATMPCSIYWDRTRSRTVAIKPKVELACSTGGVERLGETKWEVVEDDIGDDDDDG